MGAQVLAGAGQHHHLRAARVQGTRGVQGQHHGALHVAGFGRLGIAGAAGVRERRAGSGGKRCKDGNEAAHHRVTRSL